MILYELRSNSSISSSHMFPLLAIPLFDFSSCPLPFSMQNLPVYVVMREPEWFVFDGELSERPNFLCSLCHILPFVNFA